MSDWRERRVLVFAHQGGSFEAPSSTLAAIDHALAQGVDAIELDVHATRDRHLVVCHDATVERTTNHRGAIAALSLDEIHQMDNAYWWSPGVIASRDLDAEQYVHRGRAPDDRRYGVATLEEVVRTFPGVLLNLDIKQTGPTVAPYEALLAEALGRWDARESVIVASFHDDAIAAFRAAAPDVATAAATGETASFYYAVRDGHRPDHLAAVALQVPMTYGDEVIVSPALVAAAHEAGLAVHAWTLNEVDEMSRALDAGVDGIISDTPTTAVALVRDRGLAWRNASPHSFDQAVDRGA